MPTAVAPATLADVQVGDLRPVDLMVSNLYPWCMALRGGNRDDFMCCRNVHTSGPHVASDGTWVVAVF